MLTQSLGQWLTLVREHWIWEEHLGIFKDIDNDIFPKLYVQGCYFYYWFFKIINTNYVYSFECMIHFIILKFEYI